MSRLRMGSYEIDGQRLEVVVDYYPGQVLRGKDFLVNGAPIVEGPPGAPIPVILTHAMETFTMTMPTYNATISKIAAYLVLHHGVATELSDEAAAKLVRECGLSAILVKGIAGGALGESPRQTYQTKGT